MRKFTFLLALLLSFVGVASAQEASGTFEDPTTAPGVTPALSTADGTQFAYYLRNVQYTQTFPTRSSKDNGVIVPVKGVDRACKVSVSRVNGNFVINVLDDNASTIVSRFMPGTGAAMLWTGDGQDNNYQWTFKEVSSEELIAFSNV